MQAYYETETEIFDNHQLTVKLPDDIPSRSVKLAIIYEAEGKAVSDEERKGAIM